jgi:hypothetical protein
MSFYRLNRQSPHTLLLISFRESNSDRSRFHTPFQGACPGERLAPILIREMRPVQERLVEFPIPPLFRVKLERVRAEDCGIADTAEQERTIGLAPFV